MTLDLKAAEYTLSGLRPFPVAVTTVDQGRANGLISLSAGAAAIVPEAPRVTISLTKYNLTHDMVLNSGVFVMHLLAAAPDPALDASLRIIMGLGGSSGRDGDKISQFDTKPGVTGSPILLDALSYVEGRVVASLDVQESTIFVADVVGAERLRADVLDRLFDRAQVAHPIVKDQDLGRRLLRFASGGGSAGVYGPVTH